MRSARLTYLLPSNNPPARP